MRSSIIVIFAVTFISSSLYAQSIAEPQTPVIVSVADIVSQQHSNRYQISLRFFVHSPVSLCGTQFILHLGASRDRSSVRSEFPLGTIYSISLPPALASALMKQSKDLESVQKQIDSGTKPAMISQGILLSEIDMKDISYPLAVSLAP